MPKSFFRFVFFFLALSCSLFSQENKVEYEKIEQVHAGQIQRIPNKYDGALLFSGDLVFKHKGATLKCDSALFDEVKNKLIAFSRVELIQKDKHLSTDSLNYNGNTQIGVAFGSVVLRDAEQTLYTQKLTYDRKKEKAFYDTGGTIISKDNTINSQVGIYDLLSKSNTFEGNVQILNKDYLIKGKNIIYSSIDDYMDFKEETFIQSRKDPEKFILTDLGRYYLGKKEAFLKARSSVHADGKSIEAEDLYYNQLTEYGKGSGNVIINDPEGKRYIQGDFGEFFAKEDSALVTQNALAVKIFDQDSLYLHADTLLSPQRNKKNLIRAYQKAKFFKSNLQGKADSISFDETQGQLYFYREPVVWSGYKQLTGDTIVVYTSPKIERLDSIEIKGSAFAIAKADSLTKTDFNQLKSRKMAGIFLNDTLDWIQAEGNAQTLTYFDEENKKTKKKERIGINRSDCGIVEVDFEEREIQVISCRIDAKSTFYPPSKFSSEMYFLPDFLWLEKERPKKWQDILSTVAQQKESVAEKEAMEIELQEQKEVTLPNEK